MKNADFFRENGALFFKNTTSLVKKIKDPASDLQDKVLVITGSDINLMFSSFRREFKPVEAAGGLVYNRSNRLLLIKRLGKWDLPKGKRDKGESLSACALREVEEECGIVPLKLLKKHAHTYHYYYMRGEWQLKKTTWFRMYYAGQKPLKPQRSEGITSVTWADERRISRISDNTYPLIYDLLSGLD